jgi:hypothetical protein
MNELQLLVDERNITGLLHPCPRIVPEAEAGKQ